MQSLQDYYNSQKDVHYVYTYTDPRNNKIFYVGKGCRYRCYNYHVGNSKLTNKINSIKKNKLMPIIKKILYGPEDFCLDYERTLIDLYGIQNLCNLSYGGTKSPMAGRFHSKETRTRMSLSQTGRVPWNVGIPMTKEQKIKISLANKGQYRSEEFKNIISKIHKGNE